MLVFFSSLVGKWVCCQCVLELGVDGDEIGKDENLEVNPDLNMNESIPAAGMVIMVFEIVMVFRRFSIVPPHEIYSANHGNTAQI